MLQCYSTPWRAAPALALLRPLQLWKNFQGSIHHPKCSKKQVACACVLFTMFSSSLDPVLVVPLLSCSSLGLPGFLGSSMWSRDLWLLPIFLQSSMHSRGCLSSSFFVCCLERSVSYPLWEVTQSHVPALSRCPALKLSFCLQWRLNLCLAFTFSHIFSSFKTEVWNMGILGFLTVKLLSVIDLMK